VFFETAPDTLFEAVNEIKSIQGDIKVLAVFEEFDAWMNQSHKMLSLLDGELQIDNVVFLATTNYIDRIPPRIKNRPSRFATVIEVGTPNAETRKAFLAGKIGKDENVDINKWVKLTDGMMLDHLKDLIVSVLCIGLPLDEAVEKLKTMNASELRDEDEDDFPDKDFGNLDDNELSPSAMMLLRSKLNKYRNPNGN
jgi:SpoVK/Ycf46/Vps4 family AAA+-type ATPase